MMFDAMRFPLILLKIFIGEIKLLIYRFVFIVSLFTRTAILLSQNEVLLQKMLIHQG